MPPSGPSGERQVTMPRATWISTVGRLGRSVPTAKMSVRAIPSRVRAGAQSCRASVAQTQCSPTVFVIFVSTMTEALLTTCAGRQSPSRLASVAASYSNRPEPCRSQVIKTSLEPKSGRSRRWCDGARGQLGCNLGCSSLRYGAVHGSTCTRSELRRERI